MLNRRGYLKNMIETCFTIGLNASLPDFASNNRESPQLDRYPCTFLRMDVDYFYEQQL